VSSDYIQVCPLCGVRLLARLGHACASANRQVAWVQVGNAPADPEPRTVVLASDYDALRTRYASAVRTLQKIQSQGSDKWRDVYACDLADMAADTLTQIGEPIEPEAQ
jgi:hypothetical protein